MKNEVSKQVVLNYLNQHAENYVESLLLQHRDDNRIVYWSEQPINNRGEFYEVEINTDSETISWKIVKGFERLNSLFSVPIKPLHTLKPRDLFRYRDDNQIWVCWLKLENDPDGNGNCYFVRPVDTTGHLQDDGESVRNDLVHYLGRYDDRF